MAKAFGQTIPPAMVWWYTRILGEVKFTGWQYFPDQYLYGYGGIIGKRIPFRLPHSQGLYGKNVSEKQRKVRIAFKDAINWWHGQTADEDVEWPNVGQRRGFQWYELAYPEGKQYYRYFMEKNLPYLFSGQYVEWASLWFWMACEWDMLSWGHDWGIAYFMFWGAWQWKYAAWRTTDGEDWLFLWKKYPWYKIRWGGLDSIHFLDKWGVTPWLNFVYK